MSGLKSVVAGCVVRAVLARFASSAIALSDCAAHHPLRPCSHAPNKNRPSVGGTLIGAYRR